MEELIVSKEELIYLFESKTLEDTGKGWLLEGEFFVDIIALHEVEPKFLSDISNAKFYKIVLKKKVNN
ncbi:hypothetical protein N5U00_05190 [Aliarcobacter butzleri]|uniref:Uncharacterized protein n=1 Tax=Aliarcobacter butzleri L355 TaxID=1447263 RepID=A0A0G9KT45_9BACT|nr:hypothetical protein [Aliarcobacter butzleri]KLE09734.1 hypothetical protein AF80_05845 [Aliarcobacter butzleri L355]MCT7574718.1 hypothetical protein [Aliarcobacter butzleri]MCT7636747.1 hypothetical protein [Aliarcobacter butzleri]MDK2046770.1 hypothetical protein [Aliarcobacter butzleri]UXC28363.1 hypothetical protein N3114_06675 [Aliarcobacter butzleri]